MLCNENWVSSHRRPFAIIFRELGRYPGFNEINSVLPDCIDTFILDIFPVFGRFKFRTSGTGSPTNSLAFKVLPLLSLSTIRDRGRHFQPDALIL
jgi:hypothetical protein